MAGLGVMVIPFVPPHPGRSRRAQPKKTQAALDMALLPQLLIRTTHQNYWPVWNESQSRKSLQQETTDETEQKRNRSG